MLLAAAPAHPPRLDTDGLDPGGLDAGGLDPGGLHAWISPLLKEGPPAHLTSQVRGLCLGWGHLLGFCLSWGSELKLLEPPAFLPPAGSSTFWWPVRGLSPPTPQHPAPNTQHGASRPLQDVPSESVVAFHSGRAAPGSRPPSPPLVGRGCPAFPLSQAPCWPWRTCGHFLLAGVTGGPEGLSLRVCTGAEPTAAFQCPSSGQGWLPAGVNARAGGRARPVRSARRGLLQQRPCLLLARLPATRPSLRS